MLLILSPRKGFTSLIDNFWETYKHDEQKSRAFKSIGGR